VNDVDRKPPSGELAAFLWIIAVLASVIELVWWFFDRLYSA
jgi:hypothetical protein